MKKKTVPFLFGAALMLSPLAAQASGSLSQASDGLMDLLTSPSASLLPGGGHQGRHHEHGRRGYSHHAGHGLYEQGRGGHGHDGGWGR